ncbi:hypothetical protein H4R33_001039 [Dimargaris cristalligena]|nr:hypothetical protein H4R33_001039 [Dimargaris cristalligena]
MFLFLYFRVEAQAIRNSFIIKFPISDYSEAKTAVARKAFIDDLRRSNIPFSLPLNYSCVVAGVNIRVGEAYLPKIRNFPSVEHINTNNLFVLKKVSHHQTRALTNNNNALPQINHDHTGVNALVSAYRLTGKGIKIGIVDSGLDYTHPAFGSCFNTTNCRVRYGYDLVGDDFTGMNEPVPDSDPLDRCNGHGTHVAGIVAGNQGQFKGVAPDATLGIYRVTGCVTASDSSDSTTSAVIMKALQMAYNDGMRIINISIANPSGASTDIDAAYSQFLVSKGVVVVSAVGNEGQFSLWMTGSPATGTDVIAVGSYEAPTQYGYGISMTNPTGLRPLMRSAPQDSTMNFSFTNIQVLRGKMASGALTACSAVTTNLKGKIALVAQGDCMFSIKAANVKAAGAVGMIVYSSTDDVLTPLGFDSPVNIPSVRVTKTTGAKLVELITKYASFRISSTEQLMVLTNPAQNTVSYYSSRGPGVNLDFKPNVVAPGSYVYSTMPTNMGTYAVMSGTSMASPYVAGCVALILQYLPGENRNSVMDLISEHAQILFNAGYARSLTPAIQGMGAIAMGNIFDDLRLRTSITSRMGDLETQGVLPGYQSFSVTLKNIGPARYSFTSSYYRSIQLSPYSADKNLIMEPTITDKYLQLVYVNSSGKGTLNPRTANLFQVKILTTEIASNSFTVFGGYLKYEFVTGGKSYDRWLPFMGMKDYLYKVPILPPPTAPGYPTMGPATKWPSLGAKPTYTMVGTDLPYFGFIQIFNSDLVLIYIAATSSTGAVTYQLANLGYYTFYRRSWDPNSDPYYFQWDGFIVDAVTMDPVKVPSGTYAIQARWLRPNRSANATDAFITWTSPKFTIGWSS